MFDDVLDLFKVLIGLLLKHEDLWSVWVAVAGNGGESSEDALDLLVFGGDFDDCLVLETHVLPDVGFKQKGHVNDSILCSYTGL